MRRNSGVDNFGAPGINLGTSHLPGKCLNHYTLWMWPGAGSYISNLLSIYYVTRYGSSRPKYAFFRIELLILSLKTNILKIKDKYK